MAAERERSQARSFLGVRMSVVGPSPRFVHDRFPAMSARRGRRCPARAHAVAVAAALQLHCAARSGVAPRNSLRSLRSLHSDNRGESDHEARAARAPTPALRCSSPPKSRPAGSPCREVHGYWCSIQTPPPCPQSGVRAGRSAPVGRREAQARGRARQRASLTDSSQVSERRERSERSELCDGATRPSIAGQSARSDDRSSEALRPARTCLCRADRCMQHGHRQTPCAMDH